MKLKAKIIKPFNLIHIECEDQIDLAQAFCRLQEMYESPNKKFRNNYFSLETYIDWYSRNQGQGVFTYIQDWEGFNVPGNVVERFNVEFNTDYTEKETQLIELIFKTLEKNGIKDGERFYVIGSLKGELDTLSHEIRHGIFYLTEGYRDDILKVLDKYKKKTHILHKKLAKMGYAETVMDDEVQAYVLTGLDSVGYSVKVTEWPKWLQKLRKELKVVEKQYLGGLRHVP